MRSGELGSKRKFEEFYSSVSLICKEACYGYVSSNKSSLSGIPNKPISILQRHIQECVSVGPQQRINGIGFPSIKYPFPCLSPFFKPIFLCNYGYPFLPFGCISQNKAVCYRIMKKNPNPHSLVSFA